MDREIPKEVRDKERKKKFIKYGAIGVAAVVCIAVLISFMRSSVNRKDLVFSEVDNGTIEVSVSASGKVVPAFEEIINSPINTRIVEVYRKGGDSVDVGTPILKLDLQSTETEYKKLLDEEQMKRYQLEQLKVNNNTYLSDLSMQVKISAMKSRVLPVFGIVPGNVHGNVHVSASFLFGGFCNAEKCEKTACLAGAVHSGSGGHGLVHRHSGVCGHLRFEQGQCDGGNQS